MMSQEAFDGLLLVLNPDREKAGKLYEDIRVKLISFFEIQGCPFSEELADETIQRAARKIAEGLEVAAGSPYPYFRGVARYVLLEYWKDPERKRVALDDLPPSKHPVTGQNELEERQGELFQRERTIDCLEQCLQSLPAENRKLFIEYHKEESTRIDKRSLMADRLGIDITALRNRITRLRVKLEQCVKDCAGRKEKG
jgi:DNA-directed RNA polymerase specialized sigma24 family protein